ncbi:MAG: hypothetical protein NC080_07510 [Paraprevotella sp.]|nr:hypothetical protein [Paraprevotella sp.]
MWKHAMRPDFRQAVLAWARRLGKDEVAMHITAIKSQQRVGVYYHCLPEYAQARKALWDMRNPHTGQQRWKDIFPAELIRHVDNQQMKITFHNDSIWQLVGSDNVDSLVGGAPVGIVMSEAALSNPVAFAYMRPMLLENNGWSIHVSSVRGKNHFFKEYTEAARDPDCYASHLSAYDVEVFSREALDKERKRYVASYGATLGAALFAQEYESRWESAVVGAVWGDELDALERQGRAMPIKYDPRYPVHTSWDIGSADGTAVLMWQVVNRVPRMIDWFFVKERGLATCAEELRNRPYRYGVHVGPHDVRAKTWELDGISRHTEAMRHGIEFTTINRPTVKSDGIAASAQLISMMEVNVSEEPVTNAADDCMFVLDTLKQYRFAFDPEKNILSKTPVHDDTSHFADALQTFAIYIATRGAKLLDGKLPIGREDIEKAEEFRYNNMRLTDILKSRGRKTSGALGGW